jgi:tetratricopeptide (TPR) repeat protein
MRQLHYSRKPSVCLSCAFHSKPVTLTCRIVLDATTPSFYTNRAISYAKLKDYATALRDFQFVTSMQTYRATAKVLVHKARCLLFLGSRSTALLALGEALTCDPANADAQTLKSRILELENYIDNYKKARSRQHWHIAKASYESCLKVYAQEDEDAPTEFGCWGIEVLIVDGDWDPAITAAKYVLCFNLNVLVRLSLIWVYVSIILRNESNLSKATEVMVLRALVLFLTAKLSDALVQITDVLKLDPDDRRAKSLRSRIKDVEKFKEDGNTFFRSGKWSDAIAKWQDALEVSSLTLLFSL